MDAAERLVRVAHLRRFGKSIKKIAETLLAHRSTIARDLKALGLVGRFDKHLSVDQIDAHVLFAIKHTVGPMVSQRSTAAYDRRSPPRTIVSHRRV